MTETEARMYLRGLTVEGKGWDTGAGVAWKDALHIATDIFAYAAIARLSREPIYDTTQMSDAPNRGIAMVEIYLSEELPDMQWFYGIFSVDDTGIWFADAPFSLDSPVRRQRVIFWRYVKGLVIHQKS